MTPEQRIKGWKVYPTVKGHFFYELYKAMAKDKGIYLLTGDLGFKMFDAHRDDFPDRFINTGAAEQSLIGIACGLALEGKKPFVYTITNFLIYRPFEWIRNYIDHESIPVRLLGGGLGKEYLEDGYTHQCEEIEQVMAIFKNINKIYPKKIDEVSKLIETLIKEDKPYFVGLPRT